MIICLLKAFLFLNLDSLIQVNSSGLNLLYVIGCYVFISLFSSINATIKPCLNQLNTDTDIDVKFFASEAMLGELFTIYKMFLSLHT